MGLQHPDQLTVEVEEPSALINPFLDLETLSLFPDNDFADLSQLETNDFSMDFFDIGEETGSVPQNTDL